MKKAISVLVITAIMLMCTFCIVGYADELIDGNEYTAVCDGTVWTWDAGAKALTYTKGDVEAEGISVPDSWTLTFSLSGNNLTWTGYTDNCETTLDDIIVPSYVKVDDDTTYSVVSCSKPCENKTTISSIKFYDGVTDIAWGGFRGCSNMTSCLLPSTIEQIDGNAFAQSGLTTITIPESAVTLGESLFYRCYSLESAYIKSEGLEAIPNGMFNECTKLSTLEYPDTVTSLGKSAFYKTTFKTFDFSGITDIGDNCFQWSTTAGFIIPESVVNIGNYAFQSNSVRYFVFMSETAPQTGTNQGIREKATGVVYVPAVSSGYEEMFPNSFKTNTMSLEYYGVRISDIVSNETGYAVSYTYNDLDYIKDNTDTTYQNDKLLIALYDADGMLVKAVTVSPVETSVQIDTEKPIATAKIFALESLSTLKPLYEAHTAVYTVE